MGLFNDILKGLPGNANLRSKVSEAKEENASLKQENASLKNDLRKAKAEVVKLKDEIDRLSHTDDLHQIAVEILELLASEALRLPLTEVQYHLGELKDHGYVNTSNLTQKDREYAVKNKLI